MTKDTSRGAGCTRGKRVLLWEGSSLSGKRAALVESSLPEMSKRNEKKRCNLLMEERALIDS